MGLKQANERASEYYEPELKHFKVLELCGRRAETEIIDDNYNLNMHVEFSRVITREQK